MPLSCIILTLHYGKWLEMLVLAGCLGINVLLVAKAYRASRFYCLGHFCSDRIELKLHYAVEDAVVRLPTERYAAGAIVPTNMCNELH